jgi:hypothetical protein
VTETEEPVVTRPVRELAPLIARQEFELILLSATTVPPTEIFEPKRVFEVREVAFDTTKVPITDRAPALT